MLHTVNKSPYANVALESCIRYLGDGDAILLLEDGVYAAAGYTARSHLIESVVKDHPVYVIEADWKARGLSNPIAGVRMADYGDFVDLLGEHRCQAWL